MTVNVSNPRLIIDEAIRRVGDIATLPEITARIVATVEDPNANAAQLHKIVSHDPALVIRILRVVNSAFYGLPGQIASIERAIVLLGVKAVKNIAVAASMRQLFRGSTLCDGYSPKDLWTHCIAVGVAARELTKILHLQLADEAFLAGMIHDVGILVELEICPEKLAAVCDRARTDPTAFCAIEDELIGINHERLGAGLCEHWKFPRSCQMVAGFHHRPSALDQRTRLLSSIVYVADTICCSQGHGFNLTGQHQVLEEADITGLGIDPVALAHLESNLPKLVENSANAFL